MSSPSGHRVLLVDDHPVVLLGMTGLLQRERWVCAIETAGDGQTALRTAATFRPTLAVVDLRLPDLDGVDLVRRLIAQDPALRVCVLTMHVGTEQVLQALASGAVGYLLKDSPPDEVRGCLRQVAEGTLVLAPPAAMVVTGSLPGGGATVALPDLTARESEVLDLLARGLPTQVIADRLHLAPKTVRNRLSEVFAKLGVQTRGEAMALARDAGLGTTAPSTSPATQPRRTGW